MRKVASKQYNTGKNSWTYMECVEWGPNQEETRWMLGPCPLCGMPTSTYGGGYSCHNDYCPKAACNFAVSSGDRPDWWGTNIEVKLDGNAWMATDDRFVNLQISHAGFGDSPDAAVREFLRTRPSLTVQALQVAFSSDPNAIHSLIINRVPCNKFLADDPFVVVDQCPVLPSENWQVGAIGLVNAVLAANSLPLVAVKFSEEKDSEGRAKMLGFCEYVPVS